MQRLATALTLATSLLLCGCFVSATPVFTPASAVRPLENGRYALFEQDQDQPSEYMDVRQRHDGIYEFVNEKGAVNPVSFHPIAGGFHVAQAGGVPIANNEKPGYGFALFRIRGREALVYVLECDKQDQAKLAAAGVEIRAQYECVIDRVADPAKLFEGLERGDHPSRMSRE